MRGLMQETPLSISSLIEYAALYHADTEIVSRTIEGDIHRYTWADALARSKRVGNALKGLGVTPGDRIATVACNGYRHLELYFGVSGIGAVLHTINPRLFGDQIAYIVNHAEDTVVFVDLPFVPLLEKLADRLAPVKTYIVMTDEDHMPRTSLPSVRCYETLLASADAELEWPVLDEHDASSLCYTSGTTGHPKGVLYSHRSTVLHSFSVCSRDGLALSSHDVALPVVPMFHANAWGVIYAAAMCGAKLVLPGVCMDGPSLYELFETEQVTLSAGVPTVWLGLLAHLRETGQSLPHMQRTVIGGSAVPASMIEAFERDYGVEVIHAWGMTETSPLGTVCNMKRKLAGEPLEKQLPVKVKQGRGVYGVEMKIVDDDGNELPRDGVAFGHLMVRGPWVARGYLKGEGGEVVDANQWFDTGDVATIDPDGFMQITDRAKDVIKSGGEWISSIEIENLAVGHPDVAEAAVIGVAHDKWGERPLLVVVPRSDGALQKGDLLGFLKGKVVDWWIPDDVVVVSELPHTATGKIQKRDLRKQFKGFRLGERDRGI